MESIRQLIKDSGLRHDFIAKRLGISKTYLSLMLSGERNMPEDYIIKIKSLCLKVLA